MPATQATMPCVDELALNLESEIKLSGMRWTAVNAFRKALGISKREISRVSKARIYFDTNDFRLMDAGVELRSQYHDKRGLYKHQVKIAVGQDDDGTLHRMEVNWYSSSQTPSFSELSDKSIQSISDPATREKMTWLKSNISSDALMPMCAIYTDRRTFDRNIGNSTYEYAHAEGALLTAAGEVLPVALLEIETKSGDGKHIHRLFNEAQNALNVREATTESVVMPGLQAMRAHIQQNGPLKQPVDFYDLTPSQWPKKVLKAIKNLIKPKAINAQVTFSLK